MKLSCTYQFAPKTPTCNTAWVASVFGVGFETGENVIADAVELDYQPGDVVLFVGPSGSGKSSLLRAAADQTPGAVWLDESADGEAALIDTLGPDPVSAARLLSSCGLAEAPLMLRTPGELSDGQQYRYALARCIGAGAQTVVADEWCAKLDRVTAKVVSRNVRKIADRRGAELAGMQGMQGIEDLVTTETASSVSSRRSAIPCIPCIPASRIGFLLATTHEDVAADLDPDAIVRCRGGGVVEVEKRRPFGARSASPTSWKSPKVPVRTGRTSLGGITAATPRASSAEPSCCGTGPSRSASA